MRVAVMACEPYSVSAAAHHHGAAHRWRLVSTAIAASMASTKSNYCRAIMDAHAIYAPLTEAFTARPIGLLVSYMTLALLTELVKRKSTPLGGSRRSGLCEHASKWDESPPPSEPHA